MSADGEGVVSHAGLGAGFSFGFPVDWRIKDIVDAIPEECWHPAIETDDELREGAWVAEATGAST